ncbi:MAG: S8 family peptidase [Micromonosporaceae bacterium]
MRGLRHLLVLAAAVPLAVAGMLPATATTVEHVKVTPASGEKVAGQYIVTLDSGIGATDVAAGVAAKPLFTYTAALNGFAAKLSSGQVSALQRNPRVARIEEDGVVRATATQNNPPWGLDRIDERERPLSDTYSYNHRGYQVKAYIIDTGIQAGHPQFDGRARNVFDAFGGSGRDCNGHGTHVAGTIGATRYGVAKRVQLRGVKVLDCNGSGTFSGVIAGVNWVTRNHGNPAVANMSLGGSRSASVNDAVTAMTRSGVFTAVAAGNSNANACNASPASAANVTTVAASDRTDTKASFSNHGSCVEVYAPGVNITSTWLNGGTNTISGTSMASPHVAGAAAIYKQLHPGASSAAVNRWIIDVSTKNVIKGSPTGTPKRLLYKRPAL